MKRWNFGRKVLALVAAGALAAGFVVLFNEPADALAHEKKPSDGLVYEIECPNVPMCTSTQHLRIYGWCDEPASCTIYRYPSSSTPHCLVCG